MHLIQVPIDIIPIDEDGYHIFLEGHIDDIPTRFLLDTGASKTVIGSNFYQLNFGNEALVDNDKGATGIGGNEIKSHYATLDKIRVGNFEVNNLKASILPFNHIFETYNKLGIDPFDAIIGMDVLVKGEAKVDIGNGILEFRSNSSESPNYYQGPISQ